MISCDLFYKFELEIKIDKECILKSLHRQPLQFAVLVRIF